MKDNNGWPFYGVPYEEWRNGMILMFSVFAGILFGIFIGVNL